MYSVPKGRGEGSQWQAAWSRAATGTDAQIIFAPCMGARKAAGKAGIFLSSFILALAPLQGADIKQYKTSGRVRSLIARALATGYLLSAPLGRRSVPCQRRKSIEVAATNACGDFLNVG